jgi:uncharacterized protein YkwD
MKLNAGLFATLLLAIGVAPLGGCGLRRNAGPNLSSPRVREGGADRRPGKAEEKGADRQRKDDNAIIDAPIETEIRRRINEIRQGRHLAPLKRNAKLDQVARAYSRRMANEGFFNHVSPSGDNASDRVRAAGLQYRMLGENLFMCENFPHPAQAATQGWMRSQGHRENILTPGFEETGVGVWHKGGKYYATQVFFTPFR